MRDARARRRVISSARRWTPAEDEQLREYATTLTSRNMHQLFPGRSWGALIARLGLLGLPTNKSRFPEHYTINETAAVLGVSPKMIRCWIRRGELEAERAPSFHGRRDGMLVSAAAVDEFVSRHPFLFTLSAFPSGPHRATLVAARPEDWMTTKEAAKVLGITACGVYQQVRNGKLLPVRFGTQSFFHRNEVERCRVERARMRMRYPHLGRGWQCIRSRRMERTA